MEGRLHVDGADLRYTDESHGDPVLLIHQAGADSTTWGDVRKHLLRDHRVITYDRRGFSGSVFEGAPTLSRHAQDAIALLEHLQAVPATVAGTSAGATIALQIALERPDVVRTMVLHELPFHSKRYPDLGAARTFMRVARLAKRGEAEEAAELFLRWAYRYPEGGTAFDRMPKSWREVARRNAIASLNDLQIATAENTIPTRLVRKTIVPAICLVGANSPRPMHAFVRRLTKALPNAIGGTIERSAHAVTFDQPVAFATKRFMPPRRHRALKPAQGDVFADSFMTRTTRLPGRLLARPYAAGVLRPLGYHASLRVASVAAFARNLNDTHRRVQASLGTWVADYPSASGIFDQFFRCSAFHPADPADARSGSFFCHLASTAR